MFSKHHPALLGLFIVILAATTATLASTPDDSHASAFGVCERNRKAIVRNEPGAKKVVYALEAHIAIPVEDTASEVDTFSLARKCLSDFDPDAAKRQALRKRFKEALLLEKPPGCPPTLLADATNNGLDAALDDFVANESSRWVVRAVIDKASGDPKYFIEVSAEFAIYVATDASMVAGHSKAWKQIETNLTETGGLAGLPEGIEKVVSARVSGVPGAAKFLGL